VPHKPCVLRPKARDDRRAEVAYYSREAGAAVADKLVKALAKAQLELERNPSIGSPTLGKLLGIEAMRTWRLNGFPLSYWYVERADHIDVIRLVGQRQDAEGVDP
jgi:toxin ParE1/3/4